jgi:hypothetical protein
VGGWVGGPSTARSSCAPVISASPSARPAPLRVLARRPAPSHLLVADAGDPVHPLAVAGARRRRVQVLPGHFHRVLGHRLAGGQARSVRCRVLFAARADGGVRRGVEGLGERGGARGGMAGLKAEGFYWGRGEPSAGVQEGSGKQACLAAPLCSGTSGGFQTHSRAPDWPAACPGPARVARHPPNQKTPATARACTRPLPRRRRALCPPPCRRRCRRRRWARPRRRRRSARARSGGCTAGAPWIGQPPTPIGPSGRAGGRGAAWARWGQHQGARPPHAAVRQGRRAARAPPAEFHAS